MKRKRVVVLGFMGLCPVGGVIWQFLHYIVGLKKLGHDVTYVEDTSRYPYDPVAFTVTEDFSYAANLLDRLSRDYGFRWCFRARYLPEVRTAGISEGELLRIYRECDVALNVCGSHEINADLGQVKNLIYLESDPGVEQIKIDIGEDEERRTFITNHTHRFTFGELVPTPEFPVPLHGVDWKPTRQPIVTDLWHTSSPPPPGARFTSICNWSTGGKNDIVWRGETYLWSKSPEFLKYADAPERCGDGFELSVDIRQDEDRARFADWNLVGTAEVSNDENYYRQYIRDSKGEFTVAKDQYVRLNTGWFSDRSACYLAAGRPVITQETGFTKFYGGKEGLFAFRNMDDVAAAVEAINSDYAKHSRAAAEIAAEYFEAEKVLASLLDRAGV